MHSLKFYLITVFTLALGYCVSAGSGALMILIGVFNVVLIVGDYYLPKDQTQPTVTYPLLYLVPLYLQLPLMVGVVVTMSVVATQQPMPPLYFLCCVYIVGLGIGAGATVPAHELIHHTRNRYSREIGRWLLALSLNHAFYIEHLYGHHKNVALVEDPVSSKKNQPFYRYCLPSMIKQVKEAWYIDSMLCKRHGIPWWRRQLLWSTVRALVVIGMVFIVGGMAATGLYLSCVLFAKVLLELINYIQHYGLHRETDEVVTADHSWNSTHCISSWLLFNLTRHSQHHLSASRPYWLALPCIDAKYTLRYGYLTTLYLALLFPKLYFKWVGE